MIMKLASWLLFGTFATSVNASNTRFIRSNDTPRDLQLSCTDPANLLKNGGPIVINGDADDWRLTPSGAPQVLNGLNTYFIANMYEAGDPTKSLLSRAYGTFICATNTLYILVHVEGTLASSIETTLGDLWLKIYDVANNVVPSSAFQIITESGQPKGWEASYNLSSGPFNVIGGKCFENVEIHANVPSSRTSSTGKLNVATKDPIALDFTCPVGPPPTTAPVPVPAPTTAPVPVPAPTTAPVPVPAPTTAPVPVPAPTTAPVPVPAPTTAPVPVPAPTTAPFPVPAPTTAPVPVPAPTTAPVPVPAPTTAPVPVPDPTTAPVPVPAPTTAPVPVPAPTTAPVPVPAPTTAPVPVPAPTTAPVPVPAPTTAPVPAPVKTMQPCEGYCNGDYPYGCAERLDWPFKFMCGPNRICYYSYTEDDEGPYDDNSSFCTYKTQTPTNPRERPSSGPPCRGYCDGEYPYGCADRLDWPYKFMCGPNRLCYYSYTEDDRGPYDDNSVFCTYKTQTPTNPRVRPVREAPPPRVETSCDDYCPGAFPYGCADSLDGVVKYMCLPGGGCYYARDANDQGPYNDNSQFCTYIDNTGDTRGGR